MKCYVNICKMYTKFIKLFLKIAVSELRTEANLMEKILSNDATYDDVLNFLNSSEDVDGVLLHCLESIQPSIKIISGSSEVDYNFDDFLRIFDAHGLEGLE